MKSTVQSFGELTAIQQAGGKGGTLARLYQAGYPVPDGFVILPAAFDGDELTPEAWEQIQSHLNHMRQTASESAFAVRSSALSEDSAQASFAGEFESVLNARSNEEVQDAIRAGRQSRHSARVQTYSQERGLDGTHEMAVVVQRLVQSEISGVLFTADPLTGNQAYMAGNFVHGLGESLVSGEVNPETFTLNRPRGKYDGPDELRRYSGKLYKMATRLTRELGGQQDIEWAIAKGKVHLLQSRPVTTLRGHNPITGEWNASLTGDYLWSCANMVEALPDVMTPCTWSIMQRWGKIARPYDVPVDYASPFSGNIGGRLYFNLTPIMSFMRGLGFSMEGIALKTEGTFGKIPDIDIPLIPYPRLMVLTRIVPNFIRHNLALGRALKGIPALAAKTPQWCETMRERIQQISSKTELAALLNDEIEPYFNRVRFSVTAGVRNEQFELEQKLSKLVGADDASTLVSNLSGFSGPLASLGPLAGLSKVARGEMSREVYMQQYGHRGPHEMEVSVPHPAEDPDWLDRKLDEFAASPVNVDDLIARQRANFDAAWGRFEQRYPRKVKSVRRKLEQITTNAHLRENIRSEYARVLGVMRSFVLRAGELTGCGDGIFFLSLDEILDTLAENEESTVYIPARRETFARHSALPPYPVVINGRFDPFEWAESPDRRSDLFDSHAAGPSPAPGALTGFAGAPGIVEGIVRRLDSAEEGDRLQPGEILVTSTTNIGWTLFFPRAAAIVTDIGAPLSHAAIVARELSIPAVVGCGNATMRLHTGDRVRVNGGQGTVEILDSR